MPRSVSIRDRRPNFSHLSANASCAPSAAGLSRVVAAQLRRVRLWPGALVLSYSASWQMHTCLHVSRPCLFFFFLIPYLCPLITYVSDCCVLKWLNETSRVCEGASLKGDFFFFFFCSLKVTCSFMQYLERGGGEGVISISQIESKAFRCDEAKASEQVSGWKVRKLVTEAAEQTPAWFS